MSTRQRSSNSKRPALRLVDFSDRELLALVVDLEGEEGWVPTESIARTIWPQRTSPDDLMHAKASVGTRFAWLKRWGVVEGGRQNGSAAAWRLTGQGRALVLGRLSQRTQEAVEGAGDDSLMHLGYALAERYIVASGAGAVVMRRAMQFAHERKRALL